MYRHNQRQLELKDFHLPFGGKLRNGNRWVKMAKFIPWEAFEPAYRKSFKGSELGPSAKSGRVALGALIIKERLGTSDEETMEQIRGNPYKNLLVIHEVYRQQQWLYDHGETRIEDRIVRAGVLGSHGRGNLSSALLGSVSDHVIRHAKQPVLVIKRD